MRIGSQTPGVGGASQTQSGADSGQYASTTVQLNETTLQQVAQRLEMLLEELMAANPQLQNPNQLKAGQSILYPTTPPAAQQGTGLAGLATAANQAFGLSSGGDQQLSTTLQKQQIDSASTNQLSTIPPYDPRKGPQITNDMWTPAMLTGDVTENQLRNIVDPAGFLNARMAALQTPTDAHFVNTFKGGTSPVNAGEMATPAQAQAMLKRLQSLGLSGGSVREVDQSNAVSYVDYGSDPRRPLYIGNLNVGLLMQRYAMYPKEQADQMTMAELHEASGQTGI